MTLHELSTQLHGLSVGGYFNREKFSPNRLETQLKAMFKGTEPGKQILMEIALPDGWWYFTITQFAPGQYDYYIPDTREQSDKLWATWTA